MHDNYYKYPEPAEETDKINLFQILTLDMILFLAFSGVLFYNGYSWYMLWLVAGFGAAMITLMIAGAVVYLQLAVKQVKNLVSRRNDIRLNDSFNLLEHADN